MKAKVFATGIIGNDAEMHKFENGNVVYTFQIATKDYYYDAQGERTDKTQWHEVKKFLKAHNEKVFGLFKKGTNITVNGDLDYSQWTREAGGEKIKMAKAYIHLADFNVNKMPNKE